MKKTMKKLLLALSCLFVLTVAQAQREETVFGKSGLRLTGAWGGWDFSLTKFDQDYGAFTGGFGGLEFNKAVLLGYGKYRLINDVQWEDDFDNNRINMEYGGLIVGVTPYASKTIHPSIQLLAGKGKVSLNDGVEDRIFTIQPALGFEVNVFRWFHLGVSGGYRFIMDTELSGLTDADLSAPYGEMKLKFGLSWGRGNRRNND
jgi:hypothetical protein